MPQRVACTRCGAHRYQAALPPLWPFCQVCGAAETVPVPRNRADLQGAIQQHRETLRALEAELAALPEAAV